MANNVQPLRIASEDRQNVMNMMLIALEVKENQQVNQPGDDRDFIIGKMNRIKDDCEMVLRLTKI